MKMSATGVMKVVIVSTSLFSLAACAATGANPSTSLNSGIEGLVTISPVGPLALDESKPTSKPYSATLLIQSAGNNQVVTQLTSDAQGKFRVALAPGAYRIVPVTANPMVPPHAEPVEVQVPKTGYVSVKIVFDSGIR